MNINIDKLIIIKKEYIQENNDESFEVWEAQPIPKDVHLYTISG